MGLEYTTDDNRKPWRPYGLPLLTKADLREAQTELYKMGAQPTVAVHMAERLAFKASRIADKALAEIMAS